MTRSKRRARNASTQDVYSDAEEENEQAVRKLHARVDNEAFGENETQNSGGNDSELDENEAFNSEDEILYGSFFSKSAPENDSDPEPGELLSDLLDNAPAPRLTTTNADLSEDSDVEGKQQKLRALVDHLHPEKKPKAREEIHESTPAPSSMFAKGIISRKEDELTLESLLGAPSKSIQSEAKDVEEAQEPQGTAHLHLNKIQKQVRAALATDESSKDLVKPLESSVVLDREVRKIAYKSKKKDLDVFQPLVKANREKQTLDLRAQAPETAKMTPAMLATNFKPQTNMELQVQKLLQSGGMDDKSIMQQEEATLAHNQVSKEEVIKRQKELSKMRSLLFYEEQKQKRIKKIKSKLYHKIRNKQDGKKSSTETNEQEMVEKRAEERMTLKHTNTSKWVKHHLKRGVLADQETRSAIAEQLQRGQDLRNKMETIHSDQDTEDEGEADLSLTLVRDAKSILNEEKDGEKVKGLHGMKFMQKAHQKQRENARIEAGKLLLELQETHDSDHNSEEEAPTKPKVDSDNMRMTKGMTACSTLTIPVDLDSTKPPSTDIQLVNKEIPSLPEVSTYPASEPDRENPWLAPQNKSKKAKKHPKPAKDFAISTAISALSTQTSSKAAPKRKFMQSSTPSTDTPPKDNIKAPKKRSKIASSQQDLVHRAFAFAQEDDTIAREKDRIASKDSETIKGAEVAKLVGMNGWGAWAGEGVPESSRQKSRQLHAEKLVQETKKQILAKRKDSKLANVLINEKKDKQAAKFTAKEVPYPFTCRAEYEMAMRNPLGNDWNTLHATNSLTMPKIIKRAGQEIAPMTLSKEQKKWSIQMLSKQRKGRF
uniref:U3 small nucleolar RNAassociated protein putative n=1 Tax=Albugo laibachii Nc14 TaxID=890382 RepID=F0WCB1_9STRA|nr:U3 small nucleolar RNAassociated protein putative [Albugo laibachii Nc14]|eukprot:CCA18825.1 U3 small nucleolar RNAassociated protein putative [Albugo laibachii Nc14]